MQATGESILNSNLLAKHGPTGLSSAREASMMFAPIDARNEAEVRLFFEELERAHPELIAAMRVMNISYYQYLIALQAADQGTTLSSASAPLTL